jgi:hypothetical protein
MKPIKLSLILVFLLISIALASKQTSNSPNLYESNPTTKQGSQSSIKQDSIPQCIHLVNLEKGNKNTEKIAETDYIFPGDMTKDQEYIIAYERALQQTKSSRNLFYNPSKQALNYIKNVAFNIIELYEKSLKDIKDVKKNPFHILAVSGRQRQTKSSGTLRRFLVEAIKSFKDPNSKITVDKLNGDSIPQALLVLKNEIKKSPPKRAALFGFMGWLGDIASAVVDLRGKDIDEDNPDQSPLANYIIQNYKDLHKSIRDHYKKYSPSAFYKGNKYNERRMCAVEENTDKVQTYIRSGVMNTGDKADNELGIKTKLSKVGWPWQTIAKKLVKYCPNEPWAGHVSGSFNELVFGLHLFSLPIGGEYKEEEKNKELAIAWASAFLIGTGMHSAIEVVVPAKKMLGELPVEMKFDSESQDFKNEICGTDLNNPTTYFNKMYTKLSENQKKKQLK